MINKVTRALLVVLMLLLSGCSQRDTNQFIWAATEGDLNTIAELLSQGIDIDVRAFDDGQTALIAAVRNGRMNIVEYLVNAGANLNLKDAGGTPVYWAAFYGQTEIFHFLVAKGAKLDADEKSLSYLLQVMQEKHLISLATQVRAEAEREAIR